MLFYLQTFCYVFKNISSKNCARIKIKDSYTNYIKLSEFFAESLHEADKLSTTKVEIVLVDTLQLHILLWQTYLLKLFKIVLIFPSPTIIISTSSPPFNIELSQWETDKEVDNGLHMKLLINYPVTEYFISSIQKIKNIFSMEFKTFLSSIQRNTIQLEVTMHVYMGKMQVKIIISYIIKECF